MDDPEIVFRIVPDRMMYAGQAILLVSYKDAEALRKRGFSMNQPEVGKDYNSIQLTFRKPLNASET